MTPMTPRQKQALDMIRSHMATSGGVSPSLAEIAAGLGLKYRSNAHALVVGLERRGLIKRGRKHAKREIVLRC